MLRGSLKNQNNNLTKIVSGINGMMQTEDLAREKTL